MTQNKKHKIGLALSGGGAMGVAHISILKELVKNNIKIDAISGTSAGALIGLLFAIGGLEKIESFTAYMDGAGFFRKKIVFPSNALKTIKSAMEKYLGVKDFSQTKIPFSCVATDIKEAKPVILDKGNVIDAVIASAAYPGIFPPQKINGRTLIDGGVIKNLPATLLQGKGLNFIIGSALHDVSEVSESYEFGLLGIHRFKIMSRALDIMQARLAEEDMKICNFVFTPPLENFEWFDFTKIEDMIKISDDYAKKTMPKLLSILNK